MLRSRMLLSVGIAAGLLQGCDDPVSYKADVRPILEEHCVECHSKARQGEGYTKSGVNMDSYESLMQGTKFGAVIKPGDSFTSALVMLVEGRADPKIKMPHGEKEGLSEGDIETIKKWIDAGAKNN